MLAIIKAYKAGLFKSSNIINNIVAGIIVGIVALPLSMAFAIASGASPEHGLYTAIIAGFIVGVFGGSRVQIAGPTGAFVVILANITAKHGIVGLQVATIIAGFMLLFMGLVKLGSVIKFIPNPVIVGFTSGIGVIIFVNEWKDFFGLNVKIPLDAHFLEKVTALLSHLPDLSYQATLLGLLSLILVIVTPKIIKPIPGPLVAMVTATILQTIFKFNNVATIGNTFGTIPQTLPTFTIPELSFNQVIVLVGPAFTIALLGAVESLLSAAAADGIIGTHHDSNQELIGQGFANVVAPFFGGFASTGAIARTVTNIRNGGNSPLAAIVHSITLVLIIIAFAPLASYIPFCALAAILFVVAYNMSDIPQFIDMIRQAPSYDVIVLLVTFFLTVFTDLVIAVNVGVILAMLFFVRRMHQAVLIEQPTKEELSEELSHYGITEVPKDTIIYSINGPFFFGVAEKLEHALATTGADPKQIVFRLKQVPFMDITGLETFDLLTQQYYKRGVNVYLCEANERVKHKLEKVGTTNWIANNNIDQPLAIIMTQLKAMQ